MPIYETEVSIYIKKTISVFVSADSENEIYDNEKLKEEVYNKYDEKLWAIDYDIDPLDTMDIYVSNIKEDINEDDVDIFLSELG